MIESKDMIGLIADLGSLGLVFWMVIRLTNHTIPRLAASFDASNEKQRKDLLDAASESRQNFLSSLKRERELQAIHGDRMIEAIKDLTKEVRAK